MDKMAREGNMKKPTGVKITAANVKDIEVFDPGGNMSDVQLWLIEEGVFGEQAKKITLGSRDFCNDKFLVIAEHPTSIFGYDIVLPMNTGAEGVEIALKLARKWGNAETKYPKDEAINVSCCGCFHGRPLAAISISSDKDATHDFGPLLPGHLEVDFGDAMARDKF